MSPISYHSTYSAILHTTFISPHTLKLDNNIPFELCQQFNTSDVSVSTVMEYIFVFDSTLYAIWVMYCLDVSALHCTSRVQYFTNLKITFDESEAFKVQEKPLL